MPIFSKIKKNPEDQVVVFVHIPKTAGTTLRKIIEKNFSTRSIYHIDGKNPAESVRAFNNLDYDEKKQFSLIQGHLNFGSINNIENKNIKHITFVRNPVERVLSYYSYILSDNFRRPQAAIAEKMSLRKYILSESDWQMNNHQTRMIAGNVSPEYGVCNEETLELAKKNINKYFEFVGLADLFDSSVLSMAKKLGWRYPNYKKLNITKNKFSIETVNNKEIKLISEENKFDIQLYKFIRNKYNNLYINHSKNQLKVFQTINKIVN